MRLCRTFQLLCLLATLSTALYAESTPDAALETCRKAAVKHLHNVSADFVTVQLGSYPGSDYFITFRALPPNAAPSSGSCFVGRDNHLNFFSLDNPHPKPVQIDAEASMYLCQMQVHERLPDIPLKSIDVRRPHHADDGSFVINFQTRVRARPEIAGSCNITTAGVLRNLLFTTPVPPASVSGTFENAGGDTFIHAMLSCKAVVSAQYPGARRDFIEVDQPPTTGATFLTNVRVRDPNGINAEGTCEVARNGHVTLNLR